MNDNSPYAAFPGHPLATVPQATLDLARGVLAEAAHDHDVDPEMADSIADAVVARLQERGLLRATTSASPIAAVLRQIPDNVRVSADLVMDGTTVAGTVDVPRDTPADVVEQLRGRLGPTIEVRIAGMTIERFNAMIGKL